MSASNKIVIVVTGEPPEDITARLGDYPAMFERAIGTTWTGGFDVVDARNASLYESAGLIVTGSSCSVHEREDWVLRAEAELRELVARDVPILGVCFGHQLLAQALGGEVQPHPRGREMSTVTIERLEEDPLLAGIDPRFIANACHRDTVLELPPNARVLGRNEHDPHQVLRFAPRAYGVQFHPEWDGAVMRAFVEARTEILEAEGIDAGALHARALDTPSGPRILQNFVTHYVRSS